MNRKDKIKKILNDLFWLSDYMFILLSYFKNYKLRLFFTTIIKIIGTLTELVIPLILAYILKTVIPDVMNNPDINGNYNITPVILYGSLMVLSALMFVLFNVIANRMASKTSTLIVECERNKLYKKIMSLKLKDIDDITIPSLVSRLSTDTYHLYNSLNTLQRLGIRSTFLFIGGIIVCSFLNIKLTLVFYVLAPIILLLIFIISKIGIKFFTKIQNKGDSLVRVVRENISGARVIKALSKEDYERGRYNKLNKEVFDLEIKSSYAMTLLNPIINYILNLAMCSVLLIGAYEINKTNLDVATLIAFISYFTIISNSIVSISRIFEQLSKGYTSSIRMRYVLDIKIERETIEAKYSDAFIEFKNVTFSYNKNGENAINNINFKINKGETLGIIGSTGSGKSTILNLIMGFYDYYSGEVYILNQDIKSLSLKDIAESSSSVLQSDILFNQSIRENLVFDRDISDDEIIEVLKDTDAYEFISRFPDGLNHIIASKGNDLSGGQKQRLLIARALLQKSKILILDDSSSALDYKTDAIIRKNIKKYDVTTIIVAQRVSSVMNQSKIIVMDDGIEIGYGTHEKLLETCKEYKLIYDVQMGDDSNG